MLILLVPTGIPPRRSYDYTAKQIRGFMRRFKLISMASELCPNRYTYLNSRGGVSCIDTFLVSSELYLKGGVTMFEIIDFIEHGSDHCPVYIRLNVHPEWKKKPKIHGRRIIRKSGYESLRQKLTKGSSHRSGVVTRVLNCFSDLDWSKARTRKDMDSL